MGASPSEYSACHNMLEVHSGAWRAPLHKPAAECITQVSRFKEAWPYGKLTRRQVTGGT